VNLLHSLTFNHEQWKVYCKEMFVSETDLELILLIFAQFTVDADDSDWCGRSMI